MTFYNKNINKKYYILRFLYYFAPRNTIIEMNHITDKELVSLFSTDKERAFNLFFQRYYIRLCMYAVQITDDFSESEDIVQSFFVSFWEKKLYKTITDNLKGYAYLCIRNASLKFIEKREKINSNDILLNEEEYLYICESLEENEREQKEKELEKALAALPEQEKRALYGIVIENKSYKVVANELHISVNTLKTYLARAMKKLRKNEKLLLESLFLINLS